MTMRKGRPGKLSGIFQKNQRALKDFLLSFIAYALPTAVLQFAVYPLVAAVAGTEENGLFLTMLNVVRLCVSVLVAPLANLRLLSKNDCTDRPKLERNFNFLFLCAVVVSAAVTVTGNLCYREKPDLFACLRLLAVLGLLCAHDYYAIAFRVIIRYKLLLVDNLLIVLGYAAGSVLFWLTGWWELIFLCGYGLGLLFVLLRSDLWRKGIHGSGARQLMPGYGQLCTSSGLTNATVYCDKLLIYPILGGSAVSVYNAASVVSKVMAIVSVPVRNVLLSYLVDVEKLNASSKKLRKVAVATTIGAVVLYGSFYLASLILCRLLYPQYYQEAIGYVPMILLAVLLETVAGVVNVILLRFGKTSLQVVVSAVKIGVYLLAVLASTLLRSGLQGFCVAILLADAAQLLLASGFLLRVLRKQPDSE